MQVGKLFLPVAQDDRAQPALWHVKRLGQRSPVALLAHQLPGLSQTVVTGVLTDRGCPWRSVIKPR
ncbi:hypothetical protein PBOI14_27480 [Pseudomonas sp. Boi14]|nr:hypothetical protein PBOI14_27480 [Pseudomonas sp. Boi14]